MYSREADLLGSQRKASCGNTLAVAACIVLLGGCAVTHLSEDGKVQVYGLAFGEIEEVVSEEGSVVASSINIQTIGLGINLLPQQNSLIFGYGRVSGVLLQNDAFISVDDSARADGLIKIQLEHLDVPGMESKGTEL